MRRPAVASSGGSGAAGGGPDAARGKERPGAPFVSVAVRVKPAAAEESVAVWPKPTEGQEECRRVCCHRGYLLEEYEFSRVFSPADDNRDLFEGLHGPTITESVFSGVSETLFAYGQTGSGKTHTIFGTGSEPGLMQFFVRSVFERAEESLGSTVHVCCYEVMGDTLTDLIKPEAMVKRGVLKPEDVVCDEMFLKTQKYRYKIVQVDSKATCLSLLQEARVNRSSGVSSFNSRSSRSHAIVHIFVQNPALNGGSDAGIASSSIGALTLVDLAGAEKEHENPSAEGRKSARLLNTSLSSLNRLLRKLQTNSLDESERRQSVLNKCLWEYLRPGCGIALIFCVSPLFRHRTTSFSTLSMATASKLIHSRRASQYIQVPSGTMQANGQQSPAMAASLAATPLKAWPSSPPHNAHETTPNARANSSDVVRRRGRTPDNQFTPRRSSTPGRESAAARVCTPRRGSNSTPAGARGGNSVVSARGRASYLGSTPRASHLPASPFCLNGLPDDTARQSTEMIELELQNSKLQRKLQKARARSRERLMGMEQRFDQLGNENALLRQDCESLRTLFIRQQQQQIAFWAGPVMEMMLPKGAAKVAADDLASMNEAVPPGAAVLAAASPMKVSGQTVNTFSISLEDDVIAMKENTVGDSLTKSCLEQKLQSSCVGNPTELPDMEATAARAECVQSLLQDRDYWHKMASRFQSEFRSGAPLVHLSLEKGTVDTRSTSQQSSQCSLESESGGKADLAWSDSGSESTRSGVQAQHD